MAPRLQFGSMRALLTFIGFVIVFGILVQLSKGFPALRVLWVALWFIFLLGGSIAILIRMWHARGISGEFWRSAHRGGQTGFLPAKWQRWVLGKEDCDAHSNVSTLPTLASKLGQRRKRELSSGCSRKRFSRVTPR